jgi:Fe2+ transport system protein FeoA
MFENRQNSSAVRLPVTPAAANPLSTGLSLNELRPGVCAAVTRIEAADDDIRRLMTMGVCAGRKVELVQPGDPLILRVLGSRIGISERLARKVRVEPCTEPECQPQQAIHSNPQRAGGKA